jgi:hypothetical protein
MLNQNKPQYYFSRAVVYEHQKKFRMAAKDFGIACNMGHKESCDLEEGVKELYQMEQGMRRTW